MTEIFKTQETGVVIPFPKKEIKATLERRTVNDNMCETGRKILRVLRNLDQELEELEP